MTVVTLTRDGNGLPLPGTGVSSLPPAEWLVGNLWTDWE